MDILFELQTRNLKRCCGCILDYVPSTLHCNLAYEIMLMAIQRGSVAIVRALLNKDCFFANASVNNNSPLHLAASKGQTDICRVLMAAGANIDARDRCGRTPLQVAVVGGYYQTCKALLLEYNASLDANDSGQSPMHLVAIHGSASICRLLLAVGCSYSCPDRNGLRPLTLALLNNSINVVNVLIDAGAMKRDLYPGADVFDNPLHIYLRYEGIRGKCLLNYNQQTTFSKYIHSPNGDGDYPLHYAARYGTARDCFYLLQMGAKVDMINRWGDTALHLAARGGKLDCASILVSKFASTTIKNHDNKCAWQVAPLNSALYYFLQTECAARTIFQSHHFTCPISLELIEDPVIGVGGHTYERQMLEKYVKACGKDPVTRQQCRLSDIRPNIAMRSLLEDLRKRGMISDTTIV